MSVKYLYFTESKAFGGNLSAAAAMPWLDQVLTMFGGSCVCVHPADADYPVTSPESYPTLESAQAAYPDHTWVYLDSNAERFLDELVHPDDNVVYCVGHDLDGYGDSVLNGEKYRIRTRHSNPFESHAIVCLSLAVMDRWIRRHGCHSGE